MSQIIEDELVEDAEIEGLPQRSRFGSFLRGLILGVLASGGVLLGISLSHPLPGNLPAGSQVQVDDGTSTPQQSVVSQTAPPATEVAEVASTEGAATASGSGSPETATDLTETTSTEPVSTASDAADAAQPPAQETTGQEETATTAPAQDTSSTSVANAPAAPSTDVTSESQEASATGTGAEVAQPAIAAENSRDTEETTELAAITPAPAETAPAAPPIPELNLPGPAYQVNASTPDLPGNAPILAIVLEDAANGSVNASNLDLWPFRVALAIAPDSPNGIAIADAARAANHEVLVQMPFARTEAEATADTLHAGLPDDALQTLTQRSLALMPKALGVVAPTEALLTSDRAALSSIMAPLKAHGFAWIDLTAGSGDTVATLASENDLPHSMSNRIVPEGSSTQQVLNGLKSAAFTARQRGSAIIRVTASEDALAALLTFALENGDNSFRIAPVSAVLERRATAQ